MNVPMREFVCPECGYDGLRLGKPTVSGGFDVNIQWGCPVCATNDKKVVWMVETTDPRSAP